MAGTGCGIRAHGLRRGQEPAGRPNGKSKKCSPAWLPAPKTRTAIREFQLRAGLIPDGFASAELLDRLRAQ